METTIEEIEKKYWPEPPADASNLVLTCHKLRKKNIESFTVEDIRVLISQNFSLEILLPLALTILHENLFAEGDYYEGDLLKSVLTTNSSFWKTHSTMKQEVIHLVTHNLGALEQLDTTEEIRKSIKAAFESFKAN